MRDRPITTLFMLESLDGKISTGNNDSLDVDRDFCRIDGVKEGLSQYYEIEQETDLFSLNTGRVMAKIGMNDRTDEPEKSPCSFIIVDNKPHLMESGIRYMCKHGKKLFLVTTNKEHVAFQLAEELDNLEVVYYEEFDLKRLMHDLKDKYGIERLTVQSGGNFNCLFLRENLLDYVNIVVAPILIGGKDVSTLIDGEGICTEEELNKLKALKLIECKVLSDSYVQLRYEVLK